MNTWVSQSACKFSHSWYASGMGLSLLEQGKVNYFNNNKPEVIHIVQPGILAVVLWHEDLGRCSVEPLRIDQCWPQAMNAWRMWGPQCRSRLPALEVGRIVKSEGNSTSPFRFCTFQGRGMQVGVREPSCPRMQQLGRAGTKQLCGGSLWKHTCLLKEIWSSQSKHPGNREKQEFLCTKGWTPQGVLSITVQARNFLVQPYMVFFHQLSFRQRQWLEENTADEPRLISGKGQDFF